MVVLNDLDRFHLASDVIDRVELLSNKAGHIKQLFRDKLIEHKQYITEHGEDMPEIRNWRWTEDFSEGDSPAPLAKGHPRGALFSDS